MATRSSSLVVLPADGGLQALYDNAIIPPNAWAYIINGDYTPGGTIHIRYGLTRYNTTAVALSDASAGQAYALGDFHRYTIASSVLTDTQKHVGVFLSATAGGIFKDDLDGTWDTLLDPWTSATTTFFPSITFADGFACFFNGRSTPQKWDGTTLNALGGSAPVGTGAAWHLRRLFVVGEASGDGSTIDYCAASDVTDWTGSDAGSLAALNENDGDYTIGVSQPLNGKIYFFKGPNTGSLHELSGNTPATWVTRQISTGSPCIGHRGVVTTNQDVYWLSRNAVHSLQQLLSTGDSVISWPLERFVSEGAFGAVSYGFHDPRRRAIVWVHGNGQNVYVYYYFLKRWTVWTLNAGDTFRCGTAAYFSTDDIHRNLFGAASGVVYQMGGLAATAAYRDVNAAGTAQDLTLTLRTPTHYNFPAAGPTTEKTLKSITLFGRTDARGGDSATASVTVQPLEENDEAASITITIPRDIDASNDFPGLAYGTALSEARSRWYAFEATLTNTQDRPEIAGYAITVDSGEDISSEPA